MNSAASPEAKRAVLVACDARVGCAAVESLADKLVSRLFASLPRTDAYVQVIQASLTPAFRIGA